MSTSPSPLPDRVDVAIVGAGLAGLMTARLLGAAGASVVVLEARDRVGGRTWSVDLGRGRFDLGGQWLGPTQDRVAALARELGAATFPTFIEGKKILDRDGQVSTYKSSIPSLPVHQLVELQLLLHRLDRMLRDIAVDDPSGSRDAELLDATTLEAWKRKHIRSRSVRGLLDAGVRTIFGAECSELSVLYFLAYLRAGGGLLRLAEAKDGAQQDRFVAGAQSLSLGLAAQLGPALALAAPVRAIAQDADGVTVETARGTVRARRAVLAIPPMLASRIAFTPALPGPKAHLLARVPMGATVKCVALYERAFWRQAGLSGEVVATGSAPVSIVYDNTSHDGAQPALLAFVVGAAARTWSARPAAGQREAVLRQLAGWFGDAAAHPIDFVAQDWSAEPWTGGCPVGVAGAGALTGCAATLRTPVGRLHFAGTETATVWTGYLEGALESGERAAREVIRGL